MSKLFVTIMGAAYTNPDVINGKATIDAAQISTAPLNVASMLVELPDYSIVSVDPILFPQNIIEFIQKFCEVTIVLPDTPLEADVATAISRATAAGLAMTIRQSEYTKPTMAVDDVVPTLITGDIDIIDSQTRGDE